MINQTQWSGWGNEKQMKTLKFPDDFVKREHPSLTRAKGAKGLPSIILRDYGDAFQYGWPSFEDNKISIIGGSDMFYCDGTDDSFEMFDFREDEPQGYLTSDQINEHLKNNPV